MNEIILALGSNRSRRRNMAKARLLLRNLLPDIVFTKTIKADAVNIQAPFFYNCMAKATTRLSPENLQQQLKEIETKIGSSHESHLQGIVVIDIDLLSYGKERFKSADWRRPYIQQLYEMLNA